MTDAQLTILVTAVVGALSGLGALIKWIANRWLDERKADREEHTAGRAADREERMLDRDERRDERALDRAERRDDRVEIARMREAVSNLVERFRVAGERGREPSTAPPSLPTAWPESETSEVRAMRDRAATPGRGVRIPRAGTQADRPYDPRKPNDKGG